jgi:glycosyltransferase involved in cell wall biosynthesis
MKRRGRHSVDKYAQVSNPLRIKSGKTRDQPLVAVIIPAYNAASTINETLTSVRAQTYCNLEVLVIDDGSDDDTATIVGKHVIEDRRVRLITQPNSGVAAARNRGIAEARADLIAPVDADDIWGQTKIEKQVDALTSNDKVGLVYAWSALIDAHGNIKGEIAAEHEGVVIQGMCSGNFIGNGSSPLMLKSAILKAGGYDPNLRSAAAQGCEDMLLYFRIAERYQFALVREHLIGYRRHRKAMSRNAPEMLKSYLIVTDEMRRKYPEYADDIDQGEKSFGFWLFRVALRSLRLDRAVSVLAVMPHDNRRYSIVQLVRRLFFRTRSQRAPKPFQAGLPREIRFERASGETLERFFERPHSADEISVTTASRGSGSP